MFPSSSLHRGYNAWERLQRRGDHCQHAFAAPRAQSATEKQHARVLQCMATTWLCHAPNQCWIISNYDAQEERFMVLRRVNSHNTAVPYVYALALSCPQRRHFWQSAIAESRDDMEVLSPKRSVDLLWALLMVVFFILWKYHQNRYEKHRSILNISNFVGEQFITNHSLCLFVMMYKKVISIPGRMLLCSCNDNATLLSSLIDGKIAAENTD